MYFGFNYYKSKTLKSSVKSLKNNFRFDIKFLRLKIDIDYYIPTFTNLSDWNKKPYQTTGGTRAKKIYINKNDEEYFFKASRELKDGSFKYPTEFWSEIVASKIGQWMGFNVLDYNIAYDIANKQKVGCLSKSMIEYSENKLSEGIDYLRGFKPKYDPKKEDQYTFEFIKNTFEHFLLESSDVHFVKMLIFDALIGNSDRHQENWGFISKFKEALESIDKNINEIKNPLKKSYFKFKKTITKTAIELQNINNNETKKISLMSQGLANLSHFSPIYDSGCCLGRELEETKIDKMLQNPQMLEAYVNKGRSEIRINEGAKKPFHFDLLTHLKDEYHFLFYSKKNFFNDNFSEFGLKKIINNIDKNLPPELSTFALPEKRKEFMIKVITLRMNKLKAIL